MSEPGGLELHLSYKKDGKTLIISKSPGGFGSSPYDQFSWRVYGSNLVFVERNEGNLGPFRLVVFSEMHQRNTTVDEHYEDYWKIVDDDGGITCHRWQNHQAKDDPHAKFFSAEYLKSF